jgi:hypothetical protein
MEFLSRSAGGDGPLVAFGGSDGIIRVLSMITWKVGCLSSFWAIIFSTSVSYEHFVITLVSCSLCEGTLEVIKDQFLV